LVIHDGNFIAELASAQQAGNNLAPAGHFLDETSKWQK